MIPTRHAAAVCAAVALAIASAVGASAAAASRSGERGQHGERRAQITAHPSKHTPRVGEQFVVRGVYDGPGPRAHEVKIQTFRDNEWLNLDGARVTTRSDGSYRVRVILRIRGVRDLRAVGIAGNGRPNSYARLVVEVLR
jgi:hypothetical protein